MPHQPFRTFKHAALASALALALAPSAQAADDPQQAQHDRQPKDLAAVEVHATPLADTAESLATPVDILAGSKLDEAKAGTLGETVAKLPGVQSSNFGPGVGRPIIRGMDGARVQVTAALVEYATRDDELAAVIAHEFAHNILKHRLALNAAGISRGLFQQRDNGAWGTYEDRMDPFISSTSFFKVEMTIAGRESMEPTLVSNAVQRIDSGRAQAALVHAAKIDRLIKGAGGAGDLWDEFLRLGLQLC